MAKQNGLGQLFLVGGFDLSGDVAAINTASTPRGVADNKQGINASAHERILTHADGMLEWGVHFNDADDQEHEAFSSLPRTNRLVSWFLGQVLGAEVFNLLGKQINYDWNRNADGDLQGTVRAEADGFAGEWAEALSAGVDTHATADENVGIDHGAQTTAGGVGFLHHLGRASGTVTYRIEDSSDSTDGADGNWATLLTFDLSAGATPAAERKTVTGTVERWTRAATAGTISNAEFAISFRRGTAQDDVDLS